MMTMTIERVLAFNGLDVLVARDEGLFAAEGLDLQIAALRPDEIRPATAPSSARRTSSRPLRSPAEGADRRAL